MSERCDLLPRRTVRHRCAPFSLADVGERIEINVVAAWVRVCFRFFSASARPRPACPLAQGPGPA
jgi:hypothetical protein